MRKKPLAVAVLVVLGLAGLALVTLQRRCIALGGSFDWFTASCAAGAPPVILQGDIHRV